MYVNSDCDDDLNVGGSDDDDDHDDDDNDDDDYVHRKRIFELRNI